MLLACQKLNFSLVSFRKCNFDRVRSKRSFWYISVLAFAGVELGLASEFQCQVPIKNRGRYEAYILKLSFALTAYANYSFDWI